MGTGGGRMEGAGNMARRGEGVHFPARGEQAHRKPVFKGHEQRL